MLDQNTDRMWYVIGAVIIGAAVIFILNGTMPELFASVGGTFEDKTKDVTEVVDGIGPVDRVGLPMDAFRVNRSQLLNYDAASGTWSLRLSAADNKLSSGLNVARGAVDVPFGSTYTLSYELWSAVDLTSHNDINNIPKDGVTWQGNDNDTTGLRKYVVPKIQANQWTTLSLSYQNSSSKNTGKQTLEDYTTFGAYNDTGDTVDVKIRNIRVTVTD